MRIVKTVALATLFAAGPLAAAQENFGAGSQAAPWLKLSNNARSTAMGEAGVAVADDVNALTLNPAGLSQLKGQEVAFMHHAYILDSSVEHIAYGLNLGGNLGAAVGLDYVNFGAIDKYSFNTATNQLEKTGSFTPNGYHLDAALGYAFGGLSVGLDAKLISETIFETAASGFAADLGALWKSEGGLSLGAAVQNLGSQLNGSSLPMGVRAGAAYRLGLGDGKDGVTVAGDASVPSADTAASSFGAGLEYSARELYALRAGYKVAGNGGASGFTLGAGLAYSVFRLDYAFSAVGALGNSNQLSVLAKF
jgi:hypothetical protein